MPKIVPLSLQSWCLNFSPVWRETERRRRRRRSSYGSATLFNFLILFITPERISLFFFLFLFSVWIFNSRNELVLNWFYVLQMSDWCFIVILVGRFSQKALEKGLFSLTDVNEWESVSFNHAQWKLVNYSLTGIYSHFFPLLHINMKSSWFKHNAHTLSSHLPPTTRVFIYLFVFYEKSIS